MLLLQIINQNNIEMKNFEELKEAIKGSSFKDEH